MIQRAAAATVVFGAAWAAGCTSPVGRPTAVVDPGFSHVRVGVRLADLMDRSWQPQVAQAEPRP